MKCPRCKEQGLKSTVQVGSSTSTAVYYPTYYDEDGKLCSSGTNKLTTHYHCSNGHNFTNYDVPESDNEFSTFCKFIPIALKPNTAGCLHDACPNCQGSGIRLDNGGFCIHSISCSCPKHQMMC